MHIDIMKDMLKKHLDRERYMHSIEVMNLSAKLADKYGVDVYKAKVAGLLHDCAKCLPYDRMVEKSIKYNADIDGLMLEGGVLLHGPVGEKIARYVFGVDDFDVLMAIKYHSTGRKDMTTLDKIIYIADYIEPERVFDGIDEIRRMVEVDLDRAVLMAIDNTIRYILSKDELIHPYTIDARNDILQNLSTIANND